MKNKNIVDYEIVEETVDLNTQRETSLKDIEMALNSLLTTQVDDAKKQQCKEANLLKDDQRKSTPKHIHIIKEVSYIVKLNRYFNFV